ncbi:MAG: hypothetical protein JWR52_1766 [Marmoricola sp.]|nr:hypothetical protein [Marmoricola sp.]
MLNARLRWTGASALGLIVIVVGATLIYVWLTGRQTRDVAMPSQQATPEQVVTAYLDALNAHDCKVAQSLYTPSWQADGRRWCEDVQHLGQVRVHQAIQEPGSSTATQLVDVAVSFDLNWRPFHDDGSMPEGPTGWGYILTRASARAPWRISDQGVG